MRLPNGNTLIACGDMPGSRHVIEVDKEGRDRVMLKLSTIDEVLGIVKSIVGAINAVGALVAAVMLFVIAVSIFINLRMSVNERLREITAFAESGFKDFSISRRKEKMPWGVPVPGDDSQVMYVWFDALTNYISTLGWPEDADGLFKKFWEEGDTLHSGNGVMLVHTLAGGDRKIRLRSGKVVGLRLAPRSTVILDNGSGEVLLE